MDRVYKSNTDETVPSIPATYGGYPRSGNKQSAKAATVIGPYWFHSVTEEIRNAIADNGITPDGNQLNQLSQAIRSIQMPPGAVVPFYNVRIDNNRHPIFWGQTSASTNWLLCDGGEDGLGGRVPDLRGRFVRGSEVSGQGVTGGSQAITLSAQNLPSHTHNVTVNSTSAGAHTHNVTVNAAGVHTHNVVSSGGHNHDRGTMEITGAVIGGGQANTWGEGAFYASGDSSPFTNADDGNSRNHVTRFAASRTWTGNTSWGGAHSHGMDQQGNHSHTVSVGDGGSFSHSHSATASATGAGSAIDVTPPYFQMAYFIKLP